MQHQTSSRAAHERSRFENRPMIMDIWRHKWNMIGQIRTKAPTYLNPNQPSTRPNPSITSTFGSRSSAPPFEAGWECRTEQVYQIPLRAIRCTSSCRTAPRLLEHCFNKHTLLGPRDDRHLDEFPKKMMKDARCRVPRSKPSIRHGYICLIDDASGLIAEKLRLNTSDLFARK